MAKEAVKPAPGKHGVVPKPATKPVSRLPKSASERARGFLHQLTSGIAGWLTFEQMRDGVDNLREAELAKPLEDIAKGRGFEVKGQFPIANLEKRRGARRKLDFVLVHRKHRIVIAIETKYKKKSRMGGSLAEDARRLRDLTLDALDARILAGDGAPIRDSVQNYTLFRAVVIVWHQSDVMGQILTEPVPIKRQFIDLVSALLPPDVEANSRHFAEAMLGARAIRPVARKSGALRPGSTFTYKRFWVACLFEQASWAKL